MKKAAVCLLCEKEIEPGKKVCQTCINDILSCPWILICNCDEDNCMSLCRDCIMFKLGKSNCTMVLNSIIQEIPSEN